VSVSEVPEVDDRLFPSAPSGRRRFGGDAGRFALPDDFDEPLADIVDMFSAEG
jgi:hypothetical protein